MPFREPVLSLCMIVRDEAAMLRGCLQSVSGVVDEVVVVDTGSSDDTPQIARSAGARVVQHPWRDNFSEARNISLGLARGDWILWMDADERLRPAEHRLLRETIASARADAFLVPILNRTSSGSHLVRAHRLFRNRKAIRFSGRVHEQISPALAAIKATVAIAPFTIEHLGYALSEERLRRKHERNLRLLTMARAERPDDAYIRFTLAQTYLLLKDFDAAERELRAALCQSDEKMARPLPADLQAAAHTNLAECALKRGDTAEALRRCRASITIVPEQATAHLMAYQAYNALGDCSAALKELETVADLIGKPSRSCVAIEITVDPADLARAMGHCCMRLGRLDEARRHFESALNAGGRSASNLAALARCALAQGRFEEAESLAREAARLVPDDDSLRDLLSFVLLKQGRFGEAAEEMAQLCMRRPDDLILRRRLAGVLVRAGRTEDALAIMTEISRLQGDDTQRIGVKEIESATIH